MEIQWFHYQIYKSFRKTFIDLVKEGKISQERLEEINQRTRDGGAEIVKFLKKVQHFMHQQHQELKWQKLILKMKKK